MIENEEEDIERSKPVNLKTIPKSLKKYVDDDEIDDETLEKL